MGVFAVVALLLIASGSGAAQQAKQVQATLDSALATESQEMRDQIVNLRKNEQLSAIPWINNRLSKLELGPQLQALLHQANLNGLRGACWPCAASALRFRHSWFTAKFGTTVMLCWSAWCLASPFFFVLFKRSRRFKHSSRSCRRPAI